MQVSAEYRACSKGASRPCGCLAEDTSAVLSVWACKGPASMDDTSNSFHEVLALRRESMQEYNDLESKSEEVHGNFPHQNLQSFP